MRRLAIVALVAGILALAVYAWRADQGRKAAERDVALDSARVIAASFREARSLKVMTITGRITARNSDRGFAGMLPSEQTAIVPFTVSYYVDLSKLPDNAYRWDAKTDTMIIRLPEVAADPPNIDYSRAQVTQTGMYISRGAGRRLAVNTAGAAKARGAAFAEEPANLAKARAAARNAIAATVAAPLRAAGLRNVKTEVIFPTEGRRSAKRWDESTPLEVILGRP